MLLNYLGGVAGTSPLEGVAKDAKRLKRGEGLPLLIRGLLKVPYVISLEVFRIGRGLGCRTIVGTAIPNNPFRIDTESRRSTADLKIDGRRTHRREATQIRGR